MARRILTLSLALIAVASFAVACGKSRIVTATTTSAEGDNRNLAAAVKTALLNDPIVGVRRIDVHVTGDAVRLTGRVASASERDRAVSIAGGVDGVRSVKSDLQIQP